MGLPHGVTLKLATSLDGRIATARGESRWITGEAARAAGHGLRAKSDAVLVGIETALADDPVLTVRDAELNGPPPARIVVDSRQRLPSAARLVETARQVPTLVVSATAPQSRLLGRGVTVIEAPGRDGRVDLRQALKVLAERGLLRILVEGGGQVAAALLRSGLVQRIEWFRAPIILGSEGRPAVGALSLDFLREAPTFCRERVVTVGQDLWESYAAVGFRTTS